MTVPAREWSDLVDIKIYADMAPHSAIVEIRYKDGKSATYPVDKPDLDVVVDSIKQQWKGFK